ncbi:MAG: hypothetical protein JKY13_01195 [Gammaproteobacteria bacterium]|nr:hypothetical protein [Gammaproteobacteria bacterium]
MKVKGEKIPMPTTARKMLGVIDHKKLTPQQKTQRIIKLLRATLRKEEKGRSDSTTGFYEICLTALSHNTDI